MNATKLSSRFATAQSPSPPVAKLGLRFTSSVLATALALAPLESVAAPPDAETPEEGVAPTEDEIPPEGEAPVEGETPPEGEAPAEGEPVDIPPPEEEPPAEVETPEGEGEGEAEAEEPPAPEVLGPLKPAEPTWGPKDQYPLNGKGMLITGGTVTGLGTAFVITSILITRCDFDSAISCKLGDQRDFLVPLAVATTGLGLMLIGVGVGNHIKYKRWKNWTPEKAAMVPTMVPGGAGMAWVGRF